MLSTENPATVKVVVVSKRFMVLTVIREILTVFVRPPGTLVPEGLMFYP